MKPAVLLSAVVALCAGASPLPKGVESDPDLAEFKALLRTFEERQREHQLGLDVGREPDSVWLKTCSGWMAQELCSTIFGSGIDEATAVREDVGHIPRAASDYRVDYEDRSVTATCKWANPSNQTYKSIWRDGIGCTLVERLSEAEIRAQALGRIHPAAPLDPSVPWPLGEGFFPELAPEGADLECVARVSAGQFADRLTNPRAIVVVYKGQLIFEQYARGITKNNKLLGWSATKSLTGTLVGIAAGQGKLDIYAPAPVPEWANDARANITVDQMLRMVSGTRWVGDLVPSTECLFYSDANCAHTSAQQPLVTEPGAEWNYNSGSSYILSRIALEQRTDQDRFNNWEWPKHKLFFPIGAQSMYIEYQPNGLFLGGAYGYGTPRDWARFGLLHLRDGVWVDGNRVLPEGWSQYARSPSDVNPGYAAHFWRSPSVDEKLFYASGFRNQNTFIFPSQDLVIVRMAMPPLVAHPIFDATAFLNDMLSCFP